MREVEGLLDKGVEALNALGGGEIYLEERNVFRVSVAGGEVESLETQETRGAGLRLFRDGRVAFGYTTDLTPEGLSRCASETGELLAINDPDDSNRLPEIDESSSPEPDSYDAALSRVDPQDKIAMARRVETSARNSDPRVTKVRSSLYHDVVGRIGVANTAGLRRAWPFSRVYASIDLVAEREDESQSGWCSEFAVRFSALDPAYVGCQAAQRAVGKLGARPGPTRRADLVLDPVVAASLLEALSPALHADNVLKGKSVFGALVGKEVAGARVTLLDDGRLAGGDRSASYDAEGVAMRCTMLIEGGVLKGFLHSSYTSVRMGAAPTGNAARRTFASPPQIAPSTLYLEPTGISRDALISDAGDGIYITEVMGLHTIDTISGDFSLGATGIAMRGGQLDHPVDRIGIAGNVLDLLRSIRSVADDLRFVPGGGAGSTTLLSGITVSGT